MIEWLQNWYASQCDGDWEHEYMVKITTIDNPGWCVSIDLYGTLLEDLNIPYSLKERSDDDWMGYSVEKAVFKGCGGANNLNEIIGTFRHLVLEHVSDQVLCRLSF